MNQPKSYTCIAIDDDPLFLRKLEVLVDGIDWLELINVFTDPKEAIPKILDHNPDILLLDLEMPDIDGHRFIDLMIKELKKQDDLKYSPKIVVISAHTDLMDFRHTSVSLSCYKSDLHSSQDLENTLIRILL